MAGNVPGFVRPGLFPGLQDLGPDALISVTLHTGPIPDPPPSPAYPRQEITWTNASAAVTHSFVVIGDALTEVFDQVNPEPFQRLREAAEQLGGGWLDEDSEAAARAVSAGWTTHPAHLVTYAPDQWPDAEDDNYDGEYVGYDHEGTGRGDPLAVVRGLSYDSVLAEIDARLRGE